MQWDLVNHLLRRINYCDCNFVLVNVEVFCPEEPERHEMKSEGGMYSSEGKDVVEKIRIKPISLTSIGFSGGAVYPHDIERRGWIYNQQ